eukprot:TRINITY_DN3845_c0_g1_i13.p7 TRINITY_DN3845_c0_g1~~TRINITY_DN3845_c0_g1_i13.p7  ORF type:complete len:103 (-),score=24.04 TRINITY_DN3845_c0_g1_i13:1181-1489(-)
MCIRDRRRVHGEIKLIIFVLFVILIQICGKQKTFPTLADVDSNGVKELLFCVNESLTGLEWRIENEPETLDSIDYEKYDEWKAVLKKFPTEFWTDEMKNEQL